MHYTGKLPELSASGVTRTAPGRSWARYNAFSSTEDLLGDGSTGRQIFVWQHFNFVCQRGKPTANSRKLCPNPPSPF